MKQVILYLLIATAWLQGCAIVDVYNVRGTEGKVVDKETKQPLEGVMVVEAWEIYRPGLHGSTAGYLPLQEARTDSDGQYRLSARGTMHVEGGYLDETAPWLIFFKPGYIFTSVMNEFHPDRRFEFNRKSDWHGKTIEMEKFKGFPKEQAKELERFDNVINNLAGAGRRCLWTGIPWTLRLIRQEDIRLTKLGANPRVAISAPRRLDELRKCYSFEEFFEVFSNGTR